MGKNIYHLSIENAFYFSFVSFVVVWFAGFLYELLEKTPGRLNMGAVIILVLSLVLILFFIALANILFGEEAGIYPGFFARLTAVFLFALVSTLILLMLGALFWYQF